MASTPTFSQRVRPQLRRLIDLKDTPQAIAKGVASGVFAALTPLFGIKFVVALATTRIIRGNLAAATLSITMCNIIVPVLPIIMAFQYAVGFCLIHGGRLPLTKPAQMHVGIEMLWTIGWPLMVGSVITALAASLLVYYLMRNACALSKKGEI